MNRAPLHAALVAVVLWLVITFAGPSILTASEASRPAELPGSTVPLPLIAGAPRTPALPVRRQPEPAGRAIPQAEGATRVQSGNLRGRASWYAADGMIAAAGPALRRFLGAHWRGSWIRVCSGSCVTVRVSDWCACPRAIIDLSDDAFRQLAPLPTGVVRVTVSRIVPPATDR